MSEAIAVAGEELSVLVARLFAAAGIPQDAARTAADALVEADLEGVASHGVMLVDMYLDRIRKGSVSAEERAVIVSDRGAAVVLDARHALGQLTGDQAIAIAVERARRHGVGVVAVRHGFHFGTARRYAVEAAAADCIGVAMCNTRPLMPAPGGAERVVGNNPLAIAVPTDGPIPIVLDMATSEAAMGKIRMAEKAGQAIPESWAVKSDGSPTTSAAEAIAGMLLPSGGPKGFGLAFVIDLLCGLLSGGASGSAVQPLYGEAAVPYDCSHLFIAIDVAHFGDPAVIRSAAAAAAERLRSGKRAPGVERLFAPGEPEWRRRERAGGTVQLAPAVADMLRRMARELGVSAAPLV
ncbi:MAG: Ldh family oxidoreductase [Hyphomicrobiales bacterium]|nr:Ldh family oxidoreductase [Hyphomicrobiales bacterium]